MVQCANKCKKVYTRHQIAQRKVPVEAVRYKQRHRGRKREERRVEALRISHGDRLLKNRVAELTKHGGRVAAFQSTAEEGCGYGESTEEGFEHVKVR